MLKSNVRRGDWIKATNKGGAMIEGQADETRPRIGFSSLNIKLDSETMVVINVNYWDVDVIKRNYVSLEES